MRSQRWHAPILVLAGAWLLASPLWMPGYTSTRGFAADNAYILGALLVVLGLAAFFNARAIQRWVDQALELQPVERWRKKGDQGSL